MNFITWLFIAEPSKGEKKTNVEGARRTVKKEPVPVHLKDFERQQLLEKGRFVKYYHTFSLQWCRIIYSQSIRDVLTLKMKVKYTYK